MRVLPLMYSTHLLLWVLLPWPLAPRNIYPLPLFSMVAECISNVLCLAVHIVNMTISVLLKPNSTSLLLPRVVMVNFCCSASLCIKAQGCPYSFIVSIWYAPLSWRYTSNLALGQGNVPTLQPRHEGWMLLSDVISKSSSLVLSLSNGLRFGSIEKMSPSSIVMAKLCPAMVKYFFCILFGEQGRPVLRSAFFVLQIYEKRIEYSI